MKDIKIHTENMYLYYGDKMALNNVSLNISENKITALIGPSGCGKSTFLRSLNRMNDLIDSVKIKGENYYASADKEDLYEAIDDVRDSLFNEISRNKEKKHTLFTRGARSVKKMLKGLSSRKP